VHASVGVGVGVGVTVRVEPEREVRRCGPREIHSLPIPESIGEK
jgi:hypothetical protein